MTQTATPTPSGDLPALTAATGAKIPFEGTKGCKLAANTDYYFAIGDADSVLEHVTAKWDVAIVVTITVECTSIPLGIGDLDAAADLTNYDNAAGNGWNQENPSSATVSTTDTTGAAGGATTSGLTVTVAGGTVGCASYHLGNIGSKRCRIKAHVGATGGQFRLVKSGKF